MNKKDNYIIIKGTKYYINYFHDEREYLGLTELDTKEIFIYSEQNQLKMAKTILHELMHAYFYECGLPMYTHDETLVTNLGEILLDVFDDFQEVIQQKTLGIRE